VLAALTQHGFRDEAATAAYRALTSFLLGHLLLEVVDGPAATGAPAPDPRLTTTTDADAEFEVALEALLEHLERIRTTRAAS
jgi:hypothetical protein